MNSESEWEFLQNEISRSHYRIEDLDAIVVHSVRAANYRVRLSVSDAIVIGGCTLIGGAVGGYLGGRLGFGIGSVAGGLTAGCYYYFDFEDIWPVIRRKCIQVYYMVLNFLSGVPLSDYANLINAIRQSNNYQHLIFNISSFLAEKLLDLSSNQSMRLLPIDN